MFETKTIEETVDIDAHVDTVWKVLVDFADYGRWNPFILRVDGPTSPREGDVLTLHTRLPNGHRSVSDNQVMRWQPPQSGEATLAYQLVGPLSAGLRIARTQRLVAIDNYRCRYVTHETFAGPLRPCLPMGQLAEATLRQADALRWAAEGAFLRTTDGSVYPVSDRAPSLPPIVF